MEPAATTAHASASRTRSRGSGRPSPRSSARSTASRSPTSTAAPASQRVLASIQAVDRYERSHHSNVHRGSHTLSAEATAAYEGARATVADHLGAADRREVDLRPQRDRGDQPRRPRLGRRQRRRRRPHRAHRDGAPLQHRPLAAARRGGGRRDRLGAGHRRGPARHGRASRSCSSASPKLVAVAHVSNVLGTENPIAEIARLAHDAGALVLVDGAQAAPKLPRRRRRARRRLLRLHRPQALRPDRGRRALGAARAAATRCRRSSAAAR